MNRTPITDLPTGCTYNVAIICSCGHRNETFYEDEIQTVCFGCAKTIAIRFKRP